MAVTRNCGMGMTITPGTLRTWSQYCNRYWTKHAETRMWPCQAVCGAFTMELKRLADGGLSWPPVYPSLVVMLRMLAILPPPISYVLVKRRYTLTFPSYSEPYLIALLFSYLITRTKQRPIFFVMWSEVVDVLHDAKFTGSACENGGVCPHFHNIGNRCMWMVSVKPLPLYVWRKSCPPPPYKFDIRLGWPQSPFWRCGEETNLFHCLESNVDTRVVQSVAYSGKL